MAEDQDMRVMGVIKKNGRESIQVGLATYKAHNYIDVRTIALNKEGKLVPTPKGITVKPVDLAELIGLLQQAQEAAKANGWLTPADLSPAQP